jgi:hypothetical protein
MSWWERFKRSSAHTQANIVCTILVMVATIAYAITAYLQLRAFNTQVTEMRAESVESSRQFQVQLGHFDAGLGRSDVLAERAGEQAAASQQMADAARKTAESAQRQEALLEAQVMPSIVIQNIDVDEPLTFGKKIANHFANVGNTTAFHLIARSRSEVLPQGQAPNFKFIEVTGSESNLGPNERFDENLTVPYMTEEQFAGVAHRTQTLYISGIFMYSDFKQINHTTYYCMMWEAVRKQFIGCRNQPKSK